MVVHVNLIFTNEKETSFNERSTTVLYIDYQCSRMKMETRLLMNMSVNVRLVLAAMGKW